MKQITTSDARRSNLLMHLQQMGAVHSEAVANAFAAIPRERFVPLFYRQERNIWQPYSETTQGERWLDLIYEDDALVTLLDEHNIPISSSSMPSIMAEMLEILDVQPGQHVLEIGTGTGYNAALLSQLTGDPRKVSTIEVNEELAISAKQILHGMVGEVNVLVGNGYELEATVPYDRIIATASAEGIPFSWYRQLVPGGRLVLPLMGSLNASGLLLIEKREKEGCGSFASLAVAFMSMQKRHPDPPPSSRDLFQLPVTARLDQVNASLIRDLTDADFRWFLQWAWEPSGVMQMVRMTLKDGKRLFQLKDPLARSIVQFKEESAGKWKGQQHGAFPLWEHLIRWHEVYEHIGRPGKCAYQIAVDEGRASFSVRTPHSTIILRENLFL